MKIITKRDVIKSAIKNFINLWGDGSYSFDDRGINVGAELKKLDPDTVVYADVDRLIGVTGNNSWTRLECSECKDDTAEVLIIVADGEASLCLSCINDAKNELDRWMYNAGYNRSYI